MPNALYYWIDWNIQEDLKESQDSMETSTRSRIKELSAGFEQTGSQVSYKTTTLQKAVDQTDDRFKPQAAAAEPSEERRPKFKTPSVFAMMVTSSGKSILMSQLSSLSLKELLCECEYRGISQLGSKDELVARLRDHVDK